MRPVFGVTAQVIKALSKVLRRWLHTRELIRDLPAWTQAYANAAAKASAAGESAKDITAKATQAAKDAASTASDYAAGTANAATDTANAAGQYAADTASAAAEKAMKVRLLWPSQNSHVTEFTRDNQLCMLIQRQLLCAITQGMGHK